MNNVKQEPDSGRWVADCPHCRRGKTYYDEATAMAWLLEHIRTEHNERF